MADQATLIGQQKQNGSAGVPGARREAGPRSPSEMGTEEAAGQVVSSVTGFGENLLNLAELQTRMAAVELRQNIDTVKTAGSILAVAAVLGLTAFPIVLAGVAELLVSELAWRRGYALLAVGLVAIAICVFVGVSAAVWLRRRQLGFPLSVEELTRNLNWVRTVLRLSGRRPTRRA